MLFRAVFWIAIILVLMPRDPGPMDSHSVSGVTADTTAGFGFLHDALISRLAQIKSDIEAEQHARGSLF